APELVLSGGGSAVLDPSSVVQEPMLLLALDAEQRTGPRGQEVRVRLASAIEPEWLLELFPDRITDEDRLVFSEDSGRVERLTRLAYGAVSLEERRIPAEPSEQVEALLADALRSRGLAGVGATPRPRAARTRDAPGRPLGAGALRVRAATVDLLATPGFLRNARRARARPRPGAPGAAPPRSQPAGGAGDPGPRGVLEPALPFPSPRAGAAVPPARLAGGPAPCLTPRAAARIAGSR